MQEKLRTATRVIHERIALDMEWVTEDVREVLEVLDKKLFDSKFKVGSIAISKSTRENFQAQLNATPSLYLRVRRIEIALFLLDYTDATVPTIAKAAAYPNAFSFNYTFKKLMGRPPHEERRAWRRLQEMEGPAEGAWVLARGHGAHRTFLAPADRKCLVGALSPRRAAFHIATLSFLVSKSHDIERISALTSKYLEGFSGDPAARPAVPEGFADPCGGAGSRKPIFQPGEDELVARAAEPTVLALTRFEEEAPEPLRPMVAHLRENFLTRGYTVQEMGEVLIASSVELARFTRLVGVSPWQFVLEARMETASRLLRDTSLSVPAIAFQVGYWDPPQFRRIFGRWSGQIPPDEYRKRSRAVAARVGTPPEEYVHWRFLEKVWKRGADEEEAVSFLRYLERVYSFAPCPLVVS